MPPFLAHHSEDILVVDDVGAKPVVEHGRVEERLETLLRGDAWRGNLIIGEPPDNRPFILRFAMPCILR